MDFLEVILSCQSKVQISFDVVNPLVQEYRKSMILSSICVLSCFRPHECRILVKILISRIMGMC